MAIDHAYMTAKGIVDVLAGQLFYISFAKYGRADFKLHRHQEVGEVSNAARKIVHIKDECF